MKRLTTIALITMTILPTVYANSNKIAFNTVMKNSQKLEELLENKRVTMNYATREIKISGKEKVKSTIWKIERFDKIDAK